MRRRACLDAGPVVLRRCIKITSDGKRPGDKLRNRAPPGTSLPGGAVFSGLAEEVRLTYPRRKRRTSMVTHKQPEGIWIPRQQPFRRGGPKADAFSLAHEESAGLGDPLRRRGPDLGMVEAEASEDPGRKDRLPDPADGQQHRGGGRSGPGDQHQAVQRPSQRRQPEGEIQGRIGGHQIDVLGEADRASGAWARLENPQGRVGRCGAPEQIEDPARGTSSRGKGAAAGGPQARDRVSPSLGESGGERRGGDRREQEGHRHQEMGAAG